MNTLRTSNHGRHPGEHGAATLVVVMSLFLVMALLAAYGNRSMMFEQRISSSYFRAGVAQEAAEAGIEWTLAQLNGDAINNSCVPVATGGTRFVDRFLAISPTDRTIKQSGSGLVATTVADCTREGTGWTCRCPDRGAWTAPAAVSGTAIMPSFGIALLPLEDPALPAGAGSVMVSSLGCTGSVVSACDLTLDKGRGSLGASAQQTLVALVSAVRTPPAAPLVVKGAVTVAGTGGLGLHNTDPRSAGLLHHVGGAATGFTESRLNSVPGTSPAQARIQDDSGFRGRSTEELFRAFMGMTPSRYASHPSLRKVNCSGGDCGAALAAAYAAGKRILWVEGDMSVLSNKIIGSATDPVVIIATGQTTLNGPFQLTGMLVSLGNVTWDNSSGTSMIVGALLVAGDLSTTGAMDIVYQPAIVDQLRNRVGSFVRVPGGWTDTQTD